MLSSYGYTFIGSTLADDPWQKKIKKRSPKTEPAVKKTQQLTTMDEVGSCSLFFKGG